jgi:D-alanyl-D-alanine carboxypeptidase/D-alanyl-D-alanine-endopeptidase (penicillin-binding protein 4)
VTATPLGLIVVIGAVAAGLLAPPAVPAGAAESAPARDRAATSGPLLAPLSVTAKRPSTAGLRAVLTPLLGDKTLGGRVSVSVRDVATGKVLFGQASTTGFIPASTTKLLTTAAALSLLGPDHRFSTRVLLNPATEPTSSKAGTTPTIVLVGGGDPLLSSKAAIALATKRGHVVYPKTTTATIDDLAARTATALLAAGHGKVALRYDASLFRQPVSPHWREVYIDSSVVAPVSALWVDEARSRAPFDARVADPAEDAATRFAALLGKRGITVAGSPAPARAAAGAKAVAAVSSAPLASIVEHVLLTSDNDGAEVLARQAALAAGRTPDFAGGAAAVLAQVRALGVGTSGVRLYDGSGLSRDGRIPAGTLTALVDVIAAGRHPELSAVLSGLPVAAFAGSLALRFRVAGDISGAGYVHAKTGTLTGVSTLAGTVLTRDGALLSFAVMADRVGPTDARPMADRIAATIAGCGCRSGSG